MEQVLVTGGNGFVALNIISQLLLKGYRVTTTIRKEAHIPNVLEALKKQGIFNVEQQLNFVIAELTADHNWENAMHGCTYVISVASPVFFETPKNEEDASKPAIDGILRILKMAEKSKKVKRVVMTSNFGAVGFSQTNKKRQTTEDDWTSLTTKGLSTYEKSKTLAEKAAWNYINTTKSTLELCTINPVAILGPALTNHFSASFMLLENLLNNSLKAIPNIPLNIVDVRDVADIHIRAMENPNTKNHRFIASADGQISLPEIAQLLKAKRPKIAHLIPEKTLPTTVLKIASIFNHKAKEALLFTRINRDISTKNAKNILQWQPITTQEETLLLAVDSLLQYKPELLIQA